MASVTQLINCKNEKINDNLSVCALIGRPVFVAVDQNDSFIFGTLDQIIQEIESYGYVVEHVTAGDEYKEITAVIQCEAALDEEPEEVWRLFTPAIPYIV